MSSLFVLAHLVSTGIGPFYDGAAHFFVSVDEVLPVLTLALLAGLRGARAGRWVLLILPAAWLAAGLVALATSIAAAQPMMTTMALLLAPGILVALDCELPLAVIVGLAAAFGVWAGLMNGNAMGVAGGGARAVAGAASSALLVTLLAAALAASIPNGWPRIVLRVAGSWIAAVALLALGWTLKH